MNINIKEGLREIARQPLVRSGAAVFFLLGGTGCGYRLVNERELPQSTATMTTEQQISRAVATAVAGRALGTATPVAEATKSPSGQRESVVDHEMKAGETYTVNDGDMVKGDVLVNGIRYFDDLPNTGLIMEIHKNDTQITAPWGANVSKVGFDQATRNAIFGDAVEGMKAKGCENGCDQVNVIKYPGGKPQGK